MTRATKSEAKLAIDSYGDLLKERAVISDIDREEIRGEIHYNILMNDPRSYKIVARGCMEAANVLASMWLGYEAAYKMLI